ncbi:MAG TPA: DivIVA domain-containing protein [Thermoleophilaceae bacterium]|nr:DivIVA domain-containing protein [Thermoleophilaceae bacterium]
MAEDDPTTPPEPRQRRARKRSAADGIRAKEFPPAMRGYDRTAVDAWREEVAELVLQLEDQAPRDAAVRRALDEVGKETSAILQRAHEAADDIASRSRSQAEGRLQRAEREAEITVSEAEARVLELNEDYKRIWDERARLLDEMRQLADDVLGVADDAADRIAPPREPDPITEENETVAVAETETETEAETEGAGAEDPTQVVEPQTPAGAQAPPKPS